MRPGGPLPRRFFSRSSLEIAPELLGCVLVRMMSDGTRLAGRIVEVEAYLGDGSDESSHAHRGPTKRNQSMFGPPGRLYTYLSYGIHTCVNVVCEREGIAAAILLRAAEPLGGEATMRRNRGLDEKAARRLVASGPGRLAQAFALGLEHDGVELKRPELFIQRRPARGPVPRIATGPRIGISHAIGLPYRFHIAGDPYVSGPRPAAAHTRRTAASEGPNRS